MKSYLSLIPISARVRRRQNRMTLLCIIFSVFLVTAIFSMADMDIRMEQARLTEKHAQEFTLQTIMNTSMGKNFFLLGGVLFILILLAGVLMISGSINSTVAQRTKFFGMMRCIGMSRQQLKRFVRLEALNWCKTAIPVGRCPGYGQFMGAMRHPAVRGPGGVFHDSSLWNQPYWNHQRYCHGYGHGAACRQGTGEAGSKGISRGGNFRKYGELRTGTAGSPYRCISH